MPLIQSIRQLESIAGPWNRLADSTEHALLRHEWFLSAARTLHSDDALTIVTETDPSGRLAAVAPLVTRRSRGLSHIELLGAALHEPSGFLYADPARRATLLESVFALNRPVMLHRVLPDTLPPVVPGPSAARRGLMVMRAAAPCLGVELGSRSTGFFEALPSKLRYDIRRARARAREFGPVTFEMLTPEPRDVDRLFAEFTRVEASGWKGRRGSALAANPSLREFFHIYAASIARLGALRLYFLRIAGAAVAVQMAVEMYARMWILKIGYDERVARCSPGLILTAEALECAVNGGLKSYEFLGGVEPWEERWRPESREHRLVAFYPWTLTGCARVSLDFMTAAWRRVRPNYDVTDAA